MKRIVLALGLFAAGVVPAAAQERINSYDSEIQVRADGSLDVTERIAVRAEGNQIRRGIYRDYPTRYRDRYGNRVKVDIDVLGVERNGVREPWFTERVSNGIRINAGNDDFLPVPADYTYTIRYRTTRQLGFFDDHDELYWNAIGTGWVFPVMGGTVEVRLPEPVPPGEMRPEAYTGVQGAQGGAYEAEVAAPGVARYRLTAPLSPYEGFTIVLSFPKGLVHEPTGTERMQWFLRDNRGVLVALAGFIILLLYMFRQWSRVGRDPAKGVVIARYEPREGQTPAGLRYVKRMGYDTRAFTADVLALAIGGHLRINHEDKFLKDEWSLARATPTSGSKPSPAQQRLLDILFGGGRESIVLKNKNASTLQSANQAHQKALGAEAQPRYFKRNLGKVGWSALIAAIAGILAFILSGGFGIIAIVVIVALMIISIAVFAWLVKAPTVEGRALMDEIEGLRLYMSVAERQELAQVRGPEEPVLDEKRYEEMLPYAVALDVEEAWTKKFTLAVGAAAAAVAASRMSWYSGRGPITDLGSFTSSIGSSLSSQISSASSPPGSSSGSGGGGSSGGGGGGGGGGGR